jgi:T-complex protein 1 subunit gamma
MNGVVLNKDITHPDMRRRIKNPRIVLLDCPLEYKKGESQTNMEFSKESDWSSARDIEEEKVKALVNMILEFNPDLVITVSGALLLTLSILCPELMSIYQDTAQFMLEKHNVSALR